MRVGQTQGQRLTGQPAADNENIELPEVIVLSHGPGLYHRFDDGTIGRQASLLFRYRVREVWARHLLYLPAAEIEAANFLPGENNSKAHGRSRSGPDTG